MDETADLSDEQRERARLEAERARHAHHPDAAEEHERRADKARYLQEKLEERRASESGPEASQEPPSRDVH